MAKTIKKCCGKCRWGGFELTTTGRPKRDSSGKCLFDATVSFDVIKHVALTQLPVNRHYSIAAMITDRPSGILSEDGENCPCFQSQVES